ncbi:MAG TPA: ABC transporter ATP-binding protein, partial [Sphingomicrobium sp.]|nr:ABC transporter ATP-binding protein [Sphingomicrobium sp.]
MTDGGPAIAPSKSSKRAAPGTEIPLRAGLGEIYRQLSQPRRRQFQLLLVLMVLGAFAELATIGAVVPFLAILVDSSGGAGLTAIDRLFDFIGAESGDARLATATALFALLASVSGIVRIWLVWSMQSFGARASHELVVDMQRRILLQPYSFHIQRNSSTLLSALSKSEMVVFNLMLPLMQSLIAGFIALFIVAALIAIDPTTAAIAAAAFCAIYAVVMLASRSRLTESSAVVGSAYDRRMKIAHESLGGIRDVIIDNSHMRYLREFDQVDSRLALARTRTAFIASAPRFVIETIGMLVIAGFALLVSQREGGLSAALPVMGAIALGAQRLLPLLQQIHSGWSVAMGHRSVLGQVLELLRLPVPAHASGGRQEPLRFRDCVSLENIGFSYAGRRGAVLEEVSFEIPRGSSLALVGPTGSGKSTLADLIMGLLEPTDGRIVVDGVAITETNRRRWQASIAHVPQSIFLTDDTIARNIALGLPDRPLDPRRIAEAARTAQLDAFIHSLPEGYDTIIGERGIRLSGGQRQRLGLARAIYKDAPVLVLDEATSALDEATEAAIIDALDKLRREGRTIIIIAHRRSTIERCD